jgi:hypothetical protein
VEDNGKVLIKDSFLRLIHKVDHRMVESAMDWVLSKAVHDLEDETFGEMLLQPIVYSPFAALFMAAAKRHACYAVDQEVDSSVSALGCTNRNDWSPKSITIKPDSAMTLGGKRDALGMMVIEVVDAPFKVDMGRCVLVTALTATEFCTN